MPKLAGPVTNNTHNVLLHTSADKKGACQYLNETFEFFKYVLPKILKFIARHTPVISCDDSMHLIVVVLIVGSES